MSTEQLGNEAFRIVRITLRLLCGFSVLAYFGLWGWLMASSPPGLPAEAGLAYFILQLTGAAVFAFLGVVFAAIILTTLIRRVRHPGIGFDGACLIGSVSSFSAACWVLFSWSR